MRKLDTIVWELRARTRRLQILSTSASWENGSPLGSWINQADLWARDVPDRRLVALCGIVARSSRDCEHRVLAASADTVTLCSRIDPTAGRDRLAFLAEVGTFLSSSFDASTLAAATPRLPVPQFADWCVLRLSPLAGSAARLLVGHSDPATEQRIRRIEQRRRLGDDWPGTLRGDGCTLTIESGVAKRADEPQSPDDSHLALAELGLVSEITVNLVGREAKLGRLTFASARHARRYGIFDVVMAMDFAQRVAASLEHATLVRRTRRATRQRDQLLATVSHDLRNPLAAILAGTHGLLASPGASTGAGSRRRIEAIRRSAQRMNRLTEDLLAVTQLETGGIALRRRTDSVAAMLGEVGELFESVAAQRSQTLTICPPSPDLLVDCDSDRVLQILSNLVGNALKFTPDGGHIEVKAWPSASDIHFAISDDGPGIRPHQLSRVFQPRWQADPRAYGGTGLGLAIAKELVVAHGGRLWAESTFGAGARFSFTLPFTAAAAATTATATVGAVAARQPKLRPPRRWRAPAAPVLLYAPGADEPGAGGTPWWSNRPN